MANYRRRYFKAQLLAEESRHAPTTPAVLHLLPAFRSAQYALMALTSQASASDADLIRRMAAGDREALRALFNRHHLRAHRFATGILRDAGKADDVVNDVFFDVWAQAPRFEGRSSVSTWILAITRFKALSVLRQRSEDPLDEEIATELEDDSDDPEISAQKTSKGEAIRRCVDALPTEHRIVVDLVYYHEKSVEEVAAILDLNESTVKTRMFYARKKLSELLRAAGLDRGWP